MKRCGETIIITKRGEIKNVRNYAKQFSSSRHHASCQIEYIHSQWKQLYCDTYYNGDIYSSGKSINGFFSGGTTKGISVLNAIVLYSDDEWILKHAKRLGGTGEYLNYR